MSRKNIDITESESEEQQLPQQWNFLSHRLTQVQKELTLLSKKYNKLDHRFNCQARQATQLNLELSQDISNIKNERISHRQVHLAILQQTKILKDEIQNQIQFKLQKIVKQIDRDNEDLTEILQKKVKNVYQQTRIYVDKAVQQLKQLLKKYVKQQTNIQKRIEQTQRKSTEKPRSSLSSRKIAGSRSAKKFNFQSQNIREADSFDGKSAQIILNSQQKQSLSSMNNIPHSNTNNSSSRVSYLKQKLKQFEKINKKYDTPKQKPPSAEKKQDVMQRMKNYKDYLQQSESQLQPSNLYKDQKEIFMKIGDKKSI